MALASLRECQAILDLLPPSIQNKKAIDLADKVGACTFGLCRALDRKLNGDGGESREKRLILRHIRSTLKNNPLFNPKARSSNGPLKNSGRVHHNTTTSKNIPFN